MLDKFDFLQAYDLQNSSRTHFYKKYLFKSLNWSSTRTTLKKGAKKKEFDEKSVLDRFKFQLENSDIEVKHTLRPDFSWACENIDQIINRFSGKKFILIFPLSSPELSHKQWPYFNSLINILKNKHNKFEIIQAPGEKEINLAKKFNATIITNKNKSLNIMELAGLIKKSSFIIGNDTGPAHMAAHLGKKGVVMFGYHTSPKKVAIETDNFKALTIKNLEDLSASAVYEKIKDNLNLIVN